MYILNKYKYNMALKKTSINLSERSLDNLEKLTESFHGSDRTKVISASLEMARYLIEKNEEGSKIMIKDNEGNYSELKILI